MTQTGTFTAFFLFFFFLSLICNCAASENRVLWNKEANPSIYRVPLLCTAYKGLGFSRFLTGVMADYMIVWRQSKPEGQLRQLTSRSSSPPSKLEICRTLCCILVSGFELWSLQGGNRILPGELEEIKCVKLSIFLKILLI